MLAVNRSTDAGSQVYKVYYDRSACEICLVYTSTSKTTISNKLCGLDINSSVRLFVIGFWRAFLVCAKSGIDPDGSKNY